MNEREEKTMLLNALMRRQRESEDLARWLVGDLGKRSEGIAHLRAELDNLESLLAKTQGEEKADG